MSLGRTVTLETHGEQVLSLLPRFFGPAGRSVSGPRGRRRSCLRGSDRRPFYSFDKVVHFILLGLLWGATWMYLALVGYRYATSPTRSGRRRSRLRRPGMRHGILKDVRPLDQQA
jgi:hypothetical protein